MGPGEDATAGARRGGREAAFARDARTLEARLNIDDDQIVALERAALDRWGRGDPSGFLEISDPDVVYFDPFAERRLDGLAALTALYESLRGQVQADRYELLNARVEMLGDAGAVLTYNYVSWSGDRENRWNCTEVYRRAADGAWRIIQTHWSPTGAGNQALAAQ